MKQILGDKEFPTDVNQFNKGLKQMMNSYCKKEQQPSNHVAHSTAHNH